MEVVAGGKAAPKIRDCGVDLLRFVACCAVVGLHTFTNGLTPLSTVAYYACGFAVPVFFMASGSFLLNRGGVEYSYVSRKLRQLAVVLGLWVLAVSALVAIGELVAGVAGWMVFPMLLLSTLKGTLFQSGLLSHCWFLWALAFLYVLLPPLSRLNTRGKLVAFGIAAAVGLAIQALSCVAGEPLEAHVPQTFRIWIWLEYFLLGGLLYPICRDGLRVGPASVFLAVITVAAVAWQLFAGSVLMPEASGAAHAEYFYDSVTSVVWCAALFVFAEALCPGRKPWVYLGSLTMGVYLLHKLVIRAAGCFMPFTDSVWGSGLGFLFVLGVSFLAIGLLKKLLPKVFKLFCSV